MMFDLLLMLAEVNDHT